jgi:alcohol dehydrogenase
MAAQGMDAFTQLLESYVSTRANPFSDALAWSGLESFCSGFWDALDGAAGEVGERGRSRLAYASLISGITLAQVGLGAVHGMASPLGALFPVPHGVACGTLVAETTRVNIRALRERSPESPALDKYARAGVLLAGGGERDHAAALTALVDTLSDWTARLSIPGLGDYGVAIGDLAPIVAASSGSSMRTNPVVLTEAELEEILQQRLNVRTLER